MGNHDAYSPAGYFSGNADIGSLPRFVREVPSRLVGFESIVRVDASLLSYGHLHELITRESRPWQYISDVAYWLYLAHLPLILMAQELVRTWNLPALVKFGLVCLGVSGVLLLIHQFFLRYTFLGTLLNRHQ